MAKQIKLMRCINHPSKKATDYDIIEKRALCFSCTKDVFINRACATTSFLEQGLARGKDNWFEEESNRSDEYIYSKDGIPFLRNE